MDGTVIYERLLTNITGYSEQYCIISLKIENNTYTTIADESGMFTFNYITLKEGENIFTIWATDKAGNISNSLNIKVIVKPIDLNVTKSVFNSPRVLICTLEEEKADNEQNNIYNEVMFIQDIFKNNNIYYYSVKQEEEFIKEFYSGKYNTFLLFDFDKMLSPQIQKELREAVFRGEGLIISWSKLTHAPFLDEVLGIKFKGYLPFENNIVTLINSPISTEGTLATKGKAQKLQVTTGEIVGYISTVHDIKEPAVVLNSYGQGKIVIFPFNFLKIGEELQKKEHKLPDISQQIENIILNSIKYVAPEKTSIEPMMILPISIDIENKGKEVELKILEQIPEEIKLIPNMFNQDMFNQRHIPDISDHVTQIAWQFKLLENEKKNLNYAIFIPDMIATYIPFTEIYYLDNNNIWQWYGKYSFEIQIASDMHRLLEEILIFLNEINLEKKEQKIRDNIIKIIRNMIVRKIKDKKDAEKNIKEIMQAIEFIMSIKSNDTNFARLKFDKLLRINETFLYKNKYCIDNK